MSCSNTFYVCFIIIMIGVVFGHDEKNTPGRVSSVCQKKRACVVEPEVTEGPYYHDTSYVRDDITEGKTGIQLNLTITVLNYATCQPIENAAVDIWHCDASGVYSWFVNNQNPAPENSTYLRGIVMTNSSGVAVIKTIYPGWYIGRATHIHMKIHINGTDTNGIYSGGSVSLTSQLFLNDSLSDTIYESSLYAGEPNSASRVLNANDNIYLSMDGMGMLDIEMMDSSQGYEGGLFGSITIAVNTGASSTGSSTSDAGTSPSPSPVVDDSSSSEESSRDSQGTRNAVSTLLALGSMVVAFMSI